MCSLKPAPEPRRYRGSLVLHLRKGQTSPGPAVRTSRTQKRKREREVSAGNNVLVKKRAPVSSTFPSRILCLCWSFYMKWSQANIFIPSFSNSWNTITVILLVKSFLRCLLFRNKMLWEWVSQAGSSCRGTREVLTRGRWQPQRPVPSWSSVCCSRI